MMHDHEHGAEQFAGHEAPIGEDADSFVYAELSDVGDTPIRDSDPGTFELACVPFFAYGLAFGDVVAAEPLQAHGLVDRVVNGVVEPSGRLTFRVQFLRASNPALARDQLLADLRTLDCPVEEWTPRLIALDVRPEAAPRVVDILESGSSRHGYEYERANAVESK
jgi:hypothetical protein